jgi:hypothetical protein
VKKCRATSVNWQRGGNGHYNRTLVRATEEQPCIRLASLMLRCQGVGPWPARLSCRSERFPRQQIVTIRALWEVCPKHRNVHREIPWPRQCHAGVKVFVLCCVEGRSTGQAIECRTWWHCVPARNFHAFVVQQQNAALPTRRCGCDSRRALQFQIYGVRQLAWLSLQNSIRLGRHQHAVPVRGHMCRSGETALQAVCGGCNSHCLHQFQSTRVSRARGR